MVDFVTYIYYTVVIFFSYIYDSINFIASIETSNFNAMTLNEEIVVRFYARISENNGSKRKLYNTLIITIDADTGHLLIISISSCPDVLLWSCSHSVMSVSEVVILLNAPYCVSCNYFYRFCGWTSKFQSQQDRFKRIIVELSVLSSRIIKFNSDKTR